MGEEIAMGMHFKRGGTLRAIAAPLLYLSLTVAVLCPSGCAAGRAGGVWPAPAQDCMAPGNLLPYWQVYPCNLLNIGF